MRLAQRAGPAKELRGVRGLPMRRTPGSAPERQDFCDVFFSIRYTEDRAIFISGSFEF